MKKQDRKNMVYFGLGTVGRDMFYALEANALIYFLSNVLNLPLSTFVAVSMVYTILRIFDAFNDPLMGLIVDNGRWKKGGKFKPPILIGAIVGAFFYMFFFTDTGFRDWRYVLIFALAYLCWDVFYGLNDIAYWSMLPSLSVDQKTREKMGAFARICANVGMFAIMVGWQPLTEALGGNSRAWFLVAGACCLFMIGFQLFTIFGVKEKVQTVSEEKTTLRGMWRVLTQNDQLLWTTLAMSLFTIGFVTTTTLSIYYMQYVYGDESMYPILAAVVGVAQLTALAIFPLISKHIERGSFYAVSTVLILVGYAFFFVANQSLLLIVIAAFFLFVGEAFIQLLMLMLLADTVEYGQLKLGKRNESITFSVQPLINKIGGAVGMGITSLCVVLSGIKKGEDAASSIGPRGQMVIKAFMILLPLVFILAGYITYKKKYRITAEYYQNIITELKKRGELNVEG